MTPDKLFTAIGTTVVGYPTAFDADAPVDAPPLEQIIASAFNAAVAGATAEAKKQLDSIAEGRDVKLHALTLTPHVRVGSVVMTCVMMFEVVLTLIGAPGLGPRDLDARVR